MKYRLKHIVEYGLLRAVGGFLCGLPDRAALAVGWALGGLVYVLLYPRMRRFQARVRAVLGAERSPREIRRITRRAWRNLCFNTVEFMRLPRMSRAWVERVVELEGPRALQEKLARREQFLVALPHMGNWELAGFATNRLGMPMSAIARRQKNPLTNAYLERVRALTGFEGLDRDRPLLRPVLRAIRSGRILATLPDVRARTAVRPVKFLGGEAAIPFGLALFARLARVPIIPIVVTRVGWTRQRWRLHAPIYPDPQLDRDADLHRMTQAMMDVFDRAIRAEPEQYFWFNKRWLLDPHPPAPAGAAGAPAGENGD